MSLKCLVIGRGEGHEQVRGGHRVEFRVCATVKADPESPIVNIRNSYDFVFIHARNIEAKRAIQDFWHQQGYKDKVVGISAGSIPDEFREIGVAEVTGVHDQADVRGWAWEQVPADFSGTAQELVSLLQVRERALVAALCILCQGYIAAHAERIGKRWGPPEIETVLGDMGWNEEVAAACSESLRDKRALVQSGAAWWRPVFGQLERASLVQRIGEELAARDFNSNPSYKPIVTLIQQIYDPTERPIELAKVAEAYSCLARELK